MKPILSVYEIDQIVDDPFSPSIRKEGITKTWHGKVTAEGKWAKGGEAAGGWLASRLDVGTYKVEHFLANSNSCLSLSIVNPPGGAALLESHDMYFIVETKRDGELLDAPFSFAITFSQKVSPAMEAKLVRGRRRS